MVLINPIPFETRQYYIIKCITKNPQLLAASVCLPRKTVWSFELRAPALYIYMYTAHIHTHYTSLYAVTATATWLDLIFTVRLFTMFSRPPPPCECRRHSDTTQKRVLESFTFFTLKMCIPGFIIIIIYYYRYYYYYFFYVHFIFYYTFFVCVLRTMTNESKIIYFRSSFIPGEGYFTGTIIMIRLRCSAQSMSIGYFRKKN